MKQSSIIPITHVLSILGGAYTAYLFYWLSLPMMSPHNLDMAMQWALMFIVVFELVFIPVRRASKWCHPYTMICFVFAMAFPCVLLPLILYSLAVIMHFFIVILAMFWLFLLAVLWLILRLFSGQTSKHAISTLNHSYPKLLILSTVLIPPIWFISVKYGPWEIYESWNILWICATLFWGGILFWSTIQSKNFEKDKFHWVRSEDYAKRHNLPLEQVMQEVRAGRLKGVDAGWSGVTWRVDDNILYVADRGSPTNQDSHQHAVT